MLRVNSKSDSTPCHSIPIPSDESNVLVVMVDNVVMVVMLRSLNESKMTGDQTCEPKCPTFKVPENGTVEDFPQFHFTSNLIQYKGGLPQITDPNEIKCQN